MVNIKELKLVKHLMQIRSMNKKDLWNNLKVKMILLFLEINKEKHAM